MKYLLGLAALTLLAVLALQWLGWPPEGVGAGGGPAAGTESPPSAQPPSPLELLDPPLEKEDYLSVVERPLFLPDRRVPEEEPEEEEKQVVEEEKTPAVELDTMDLTAIVITPTESVAWVSSGSKPKPERLRAGDELEGWTVKEIKEGEIELERQGKSDTLILRDYSKSPPQPARPPQRAARRPNAARRPASGDNADPPPAEKAPEKRTTTTHAPVPP